MCAYLGGVFSHFVSPVQVSAGVLIFLTSSWITGVMGVCVCVSVTEGR